MTELDDAQQAGEDDEAPPRRSFLRTAGLAGALGGAGLVGYVARGGASAPFGRMWNHDEVEAKNMAGVEPATREALGTRQVIWSVETTEPVVALTFDDGPDPEFTPAVLEALAAHDIRATFNVMGWNADRHRDLLAEVVKAGHEIGNHSWSHRDHAITEAAEIVDEMKRGTEMIESLTGTRPRFFRPPRGVVTGLTLKTAAELGQEVLVWSISGSVFDPSTTDGVAGWVVPNVARGDIVSFHDGIGRGTFDRDGSNARHLIGRRRSEIDALPGVLEGLLERGLRFDTVGGLLDGAPDPRHGPCV